MGAGYHGGFGCTLGNLRFASGDVTYKSKPEMYFELAAIRKKIDPDGVFDVVAHGGSNIIQIELNGKNKRIIARDLARRLKHLQKYKRKQAIRLLSCDTGSNDLGFAQQLANKLNVTVYAPTKRYWALSNGEYIIAGAKIVEGKEYPNLNDKGYMKTFKPGGKFKK